MTEREVLKLALEALENTTPTGFNMERDKQFFAAITAIKEVLAQPEQHQDWCASLTQMLASMPPQPAPCNCKPEPVIDKSAAVRIATSLGWEPKRKPLTDEQIDKEFEAYAAQFDTLSDEWQDMGAGDYFKAGFKAAHGIKE